MAEAGAKICVLTERYPPQTGGVAVAARRLVGLLVEAGHEVHVLHPCVRSSGPLECVVSQEDGAAVSRLYYVDFDDRTVVELYRTLVRMHIDRGFDLLHAFFLTMAHVVHVVNHHPWVPHPARRVIASVRGSDALTHIFMPWWRDTIAEAVAAPTTWVSSVNRFYIRYLEDELGLDLSSRSTVIYNGVAAVDEQRRWRLGGHNRGVVGTIGAFRRVKDLPLLIRAYAGLAPEQRVALRLAGFFEPEDREEEEWSRCLIAELGIGGEVVETGRFPHDQVGEQLRRMHVYVQSSAYEGLPNALLEAASHGVPLVATAVGGMAEIIEHGDSGLLVPHGDPGAMAAAIASVLTSDELARRLSAGALRLAERHSIASEAAGWKRLYDHLLGLPPAPKLHLPSLSSPAVERLRSGG